MITELIRSFKNKINIRPVFGIFSKTIDPAFIECIGYAGFDFVIIDMEHGPNNTFSAQNLVRAAQISNLLPIVRVKEDNDTLIGEVLDIGCGGIQIPKVKNIENIIRIKKAAKFAPLGERGVCRFVRSAGYSAVDQKRYYKESNESLIIIQLEGKEAIENLNDILDVEYYDIVFIGPYDLSQTLGVTGEINHPLVEKMILDIVRKCEKKGKIVGNFSDSIENAIKWINLGIRYISYSVDVGIFYDSCKNLLQDLKKYKSSKF